ncbi:hypothetical protein HAX54_020594 [Datura stramonium]|uniref:Uncharacterized protein n=1 Tax=Datura stramonium TaxID=4076 RepID=A0ABS8UTK1_DATST|nr:hypothetical protein [Datura stramonium]
MSILLDEGQLQSTNSISRELAIRWLHFSDMGNSSTHVPAGSVELMQNNRNAKECWYHRKSELDTTNTKDATVNAKPPQETHAKSSIDVKAFNKVHRKEWRIMVLFLLGKEKAQRFCIRTRKG